MDHAGEFFDPFARVYDARMARSADEDGTVTRDVAFYRDLAAETEGPALEVGVGTDRVCLELHEPGVDVDGIDRSTGILERLREKVDRRGLDPAVWMADLTALQPEREYRLVYAPSWVFNHVSTLAVQRALLQRVRDVLRPGGRFVLNTFVPGFEVVVEEYGEEQVEPLEKDGTTDRFVAVSTIDDEGEQVVRLRKELYQVGNSGDVGGGDGTGDELVAECETPLALIPKRQFELPFEQAGFSEWSVFGGFDGEPLETTDQEMVWIVGR
jgi:SAM-dependent methyltransferase